VPGYQKLQMAAQSGLAQDASELYPYGNSGLIVITVSVNSKWGVGPVMQFVEGPPVNVLRHWLNKMFIILLYARRTCLVRWKQALLIPAGIWTIQLSIMWILFSDVKLYAFCTVIGQSHCSN